MWKVPVPDREGIHHVPADQLTEAERTTLGDLWNSFEKVLSGKDPDAARPFEGIEIGGYQLVTDPTDIEYLAFNGELDIDDFYTLAES